MDQHVMMSPNGSVSVSQSIDGLRMTSSIGGSGMIISIPSAEKAQELIDALTLARAQRWQS